MASFRRLMSLTRTAAQVPVALTGTACLLGGMVAWAGPAVADSPLPAPQSVHVSASGTLTWATVAGATGYWIERDGQLVAGGLTPGVPANTMIYQDPTTGKTDFSAHTYQVAAIGGSGWTLNWSKPTTEPPVGMTQDDGQLKWDSVLGHSNPTDGYYVSINDTLSELVQAPSGQFQTYALPNSLTPGKTYTFSVASTYNGIRNSDASWGVSFRYVPPVSGVTAKAVHIGTGFGIHLHWNANYISPDAKFKVMRDGVIIGEPSATDFYDWNAAPNTVHAYAVQEYLQFSPNPYGGSAWSDVSGEWCLAGTPCY